MQYCEIKKIPNHDLDFIKGSCEQLINKLSYANVFIYYIYYYNFY